MFSCLWTSCRRIPPDIRRLVIAYQELVGEGLDVALVMAGLPGAVSATLNDHVLTFLNRATKVELGPLRLGDVDAFFNDAFEQLGVSISTEIRKRAARATGGVSVSAAARGALPGAVRLFRS